MTETTLVLRDFFERYIVYPWESFRPIDILDWLVMTALFYTLYMLFRGSSAARMIWGLVFMAVLSFLAEHMGMSGLHSIMSIITPYAVVLVAVIYQPELRVILARIGSMVIRLRKKKSNESKYQTEITIHKVADAACQIAQTEKDGALIVLELFQKVDENIDKGYALDLEVESSTLCGLFRDKTLFHDGAVVIRKNRIVMAGCKLPLRKNGDVVDGLGTRHRAAVGISEMTDCVVVVVSEESHKISVANNGNIFREFNQSAEELRNPETRQWVEKSLRYTLYNMLIGLDLKDSQMQEEKGLRVRFKWGFNLDAEDRERINQEREKESSELERFEKSYSKKKAVQAQDEGGRGADLTAPDSTPIPVAPSEENAGMPSIAMTPVELRDRPEDTDKTPSGEA